MQQLGKVQQLLLKLFYLSVASGFLFLMTLSLFDEGSYLAGIGKSVILAMVFLCLVGFFHPLKMLPLLLFSIAWKSIWLIAFVIPAYFGSGLDEVTKNILFPVSIGFIVTAAITPWRYVVNLYFPSSRNNLSI